MNIEYKFSKNPREGTSFTLIRTKLSTDGHRELILNLAKDSKSDKFAVLQENDLLILEKDLFGGQTKDILVVEEATQMPLSQGSAQMVKVRGYDVNVYGLDEFEDGQKFYVLGRVEQVPE